MEGNMPAKKRVAKPGLVKRTSTVSSTGTRACYYWRQKVSTRGAITMDKSRFNGGGGWSDMSSPPTYPEV